VNVVLPAAGKKAASRRYFFRLLALASTAVFGIWFLAQACILAYLYFQRDGHFPLFITRQDFMETALLGLGFVFSGILYSLLARETKTAPSQ
jgi:hypothetical protein